jgi:CDP-diacylglycerol--glycerol-3-phosphate 3-phosphatidyltransferase
MSRSQLPNALTIARLVLLPVYAVLILTCEGGRSWPAAIVFGVAGVTDQIDGFLARRWHVESAFGKFVDPLADRLMIDTAVLLLLHAGRLPWVALLIPLRDLVVLVGTPIVLGRGYEFQVNLIGKTATWLLYASLGFVMVTHDGTTWPLWIFWAGFALALVALAEYALKARREVLA